MSDARGSADFHRDPLPAAHKTDMDYPVQENRDSGDAPGLNAVLGPSDLLEEKLAEQVTAAQADDRLAPVGVLLGGTLQRPYLQRRLADLTGGIVNVRFLMPSELAMALGEREMIRQGKRPLPPLADRILLRQIA